MNKILRNRKSQSGLLAAILSFVLVGSSIFLGANMTNETNFTGNVMQNLQTQTAFGETDIEVWADTNISIINKTSILLKLDNETAIENQEIEFYLNDSLVSKEITNSQGIASSPFNLPNEIPGTYSIIFQGNSVLFLNPSSLEFYLGDLNLTFNETNETLLNLTNITFESCKTFEEHILWSSGFSNKQKGSTNYQIWTPKYNCSEIGQENCLIADIILDSRIISIDLPEGENEGEGYAQISELNNCNAPEIGKYSDYIVNEKISGEEIKRGKYCGAGKGKECENEINFQIINYSSCYGIKSYSSQYSITDVFSIKYDLCKGAENE